MAQACISVPSTLKCSPDNISCRIDRGISTACYTGYWLLVAGLAKRIRRHLRPSYVELDLAARSPENPGFAALTWIKGVFAKQQRLSQRPLAECPVATLPKHLRPYLLIFGADDQPTGLHGDRYELWLYSQIRKRFESGEIYLDDSLQHRHVSDDLVSMEEKADVLAQMDIPFLRQPIDAQLDVLTTELRAQWIAFNQELKQGKLTHLEYDKNTQKLIWRKPKTENQKAREQAFYEQLPFCDVADVFRFINGQSQLLSALTPLQPRYAKKVADADSLMAAIIAQAMNHGNQVMARTSDILYHVLDSTYQQYLRQATLHAANDCISNAIAALPIFPHYSFDLGALYGAVDGRKFGVERPTVKAQYSRKYFDRGKGVVYTLLCNHVPLNGYLIGAHEYEAHHVFDIWYRNTSDIVLTAITGDMHSINKANFAILYWFGLRFESRFTNLDDQLQELYCIDAPALYEKYLIQPVGQIDRQLIASEKANIEQIVAALGLKEITQGSLIRELCTYSQGNPTRRAIFALDKLIRSIYTLRYLRDPQLERNVHRSQNRLESYHQLRSSIAQVGGKERIDRSHRHRNRDQQPVRPADRQRDHLLQLGDSVAAADEMGSQWQHQGAGADRADIAGRLAAYPAKRTLHLPKRQQNRPGRTHRRTRIGVTKFPAVPNWNPLFLLRWNTMLQPSDPLPPSVVDTW